MKRTYWLAPLAACALVLSGCERVDENGATTTSEASSGTLSAALAEADGLSQVAGVVDDAQLAGVFDGASSYTILAPTDDAFATLGDALSEGSDSAPLVALLRNHIVTGYLSPEDIRTAVANASEGSVEMSSVGSDTVTFVMEGDALVARGADGSQASLLVDRAVEASNGVIIPIDGVLRRVPETVAAR